MGIAVLAVTGVVVKVFSGVGVNDGVDDGLLVDSGVAVFVGVFTGVLVGVLVWVLVIFCRIKEEKKSETRG